jgi:hypothetical protein
MANNLFQDTFGNAVELTAAIQRNPVNMGTLAKLKQFTESGVSTTECLIDYKTDVIRLVPVAPRGGVADPYQSGTEDGVKISALHIPTRSSVYADECQDKRAFGTTDLDSPLALRDRKLRGMRMNIEATIENLRFGAIRGKVLDFDGSELLDLYALFGITQTSLSLDLNVSTTQILNRVIAAERESEDACSGAVPAGYVVLAAPDFMDKLRSNPAYDTSLRYGRPSELMKDFRNGIAIGNSTFIECRSTPGLPVRIPAGEAYMVPQGIADLLITRYAPGDYMTAVNTPGQPLYVVSEEMPMGKGYALEAQSNPINFCSRPGAIIRLTAEAE